MVSPSLKHCPQSKRAPGFAQAFCPHSGQVNFLLLAFFALPTGHVSIFSARWYIIPTYSTIGKAAKSGVPINPFLIGTGICTTDTCRLCCLVCRPIQQGRHFKKYEHSSPTTREWWYSLISLRNDSS